MKNFDVEQTEPVGRMINRVRALVKSISLGTTTDSVLEILGPPDQKMLGLEGYLQNEAVSSVNEFLPLLQLTKPLTDETWMYINPFRTSTRHFLSISNDKVEKIWEVQKSL